MSRVWLEIIWATATTRIESLEAAVRKTLDRIGSWRGQFLWVEEGEPAFPVLRAFATFLVERRLRPGARLIGSEALSFESFLRSGAWEAGRRDDEERHAAFTAPGVGIEP